ncbi:MAG: transposase [Pirellulales bacterium]
MASVTGSIVSIEEALMEMYLAGVSVRRVEDITEALWGTRVFPSAVSDLNQKLYERIERGETSQLKTSSLTSHWTASG